LTGVIFRVLRLGLAAGSLAGCHDWERFSAPPDARAPLPPAGDGGVVGEVSGAFACAAPYVLLPVLEPGMAPRIERIAMSGATGARCESLRVWGLSPGEPIRAVAAYGDRVLAAGDRGACVLEVQPELLRGRFAPWPLSMASAPRDAFVFDDGAPRFAASFAIGTADTVNQVIVEQEPASLTRVLTAGSTPAIPSALIGRGLLKSIAHDPTRLSTLYGARAAEDYLVSVRADGTERAVVRSSMSGSEGFGAVAAGPPMEGASPRLAMTLRDGSNRFSFVNGAEGSSGAVCAPCRRITHALPLDAAERSFVLVCDEAESGPGLYVYRGGTCTVAYPLSSGFLLGRAAIRYPGTP
jgi:hypothetical protein